MADIPPGRHPPYLADSPSPSRYPPRQTPPPPRQMVNKRTVLIPLECILVFNEFIDSIYTCIYAKKLDCLTCNVIANSFRVSLFVYLGCSSDLENDIYLIQWLISDLFISDVIYIYMLASERQTTRRHFLMNVFGKGKHRVQICLLFQTSTTLNFIFWKTESNQTSTILTIRTRRNYLMHANFESLSFRKKNSWTKRSELVK